MEQEQYKVGREHHAVLIGANGRQIQKVTHTSLRPDRVDNMYNCIKTLQIEKDHGGNKQPLQNEVIQIRYGRRASKTT